MGKDKQRDTAVVKASTAPWEEEMRNNRVVEPCVMIEVVVARRLLSTLNI